MPDPDETDLIDSEDLAADHSQDIEPPRYFKRGDPIPHLPLEQILEFENNHPRHTGDKEALIGTTFGIRPANYYQQLNTAIDDPTAIALNPALCRRLQERRARRHAARQSRQLAPTK